MAQDFSRLTRSFITVAGLMALAACGGGGGSLGAGGGNGGGATVTVSGRITFDRLEFQPTLGHGLNAASPVESPAREVVVQVVAGANVTTTTTDANGDYSVSVPANTNMFVRVRAQMLKEGSAPTWNFTVRNNANSDAVYALEGTSFNSGTTNVTRNLRAPSDWNGNGYNSGRRAAPFAILDTVYRAKQLILSAAPTAQFPELNLYWSEENRSADPFCPDDGNIGTSFYFRDPSDSVTDDCDTPAVVPDGIYILGDFDIGDTDEYDAHVIAHEFGHYIEDRFSRSDSIGGEHSLGNRLDLRVAFGEGWGNAFGAMSLANPVYRDSFGGISQDGGFNLETGSPVPEGWFSEASVGEILWDIFDTTPESGDNVTLGFTPIYNVMVGPQVSTDALTSIFSFASALRDANGSSSGAIGSLLSNESISGNDAFGTGETNDGNGTDPGFTGVYIHVEEGAPVADICSTSNASGNVDGNKLGNRRFLRFVKNTTGLVNIQLDGIASPTVPNSAPAEDPDIVVHLRGFPQSFGTQNGLPIGQSGEPRLETMQVQLAAGIYVLEVYDYEVIDPNVDPADRPSIPRCMSVSISGSS